MGDIIGLGLSHGPHGAHQDHTMANYVKRAMVSPKTPIELKDPRNWPAEMQLEWGDDEGRTAAHQHRTKLADGYRRVREALDEFNPDAVVIFGDDRYENFQEDIIPAFCVYIEDEYVTRPWGSMGRGGSLNPADNIFGEDAEFELRMPGAREAAKGLAVHLLGNGFDIAYAYKQLHKDMSHAFGQTVSYLDYDRDKGWPYPLIPFHVNCYGSRFTRGRSGEEFDPAGPTPQRCFDIGAATAEFFRDSPWKVAIIGSSSWSHGSLTAKHHFMWPDVVADRRRFAELKEGAYKAWRDIPTAEIEDSGQNELLNWICLAGAMDALGHKPTDLEFVESWLFNSSKTIGVFNPA